MAIPTSANTTITTNEDTAKVLLVSDFSFTDTDPLDVLVKVKITTLPTVGTLTLLGTNVLLNQEILVASITSGYLVYTPALNASGIAYATIGFMVSDGTNYSTPANTITIDVTAVNDAPTCSNYSIVALRDIQYNGVLPAASDVEGSAITYAKATNPGHGTAVVNTNGTFSYTPVQSYSGYDSFTFTVSDGSLTNTYMVTVLVTISLTFDDVTTISGVVTGTADVTTEINNSTGAFDRLMKAVNTHLALQHLEGRIKGAEYAQVYLGALQTAMTQAVQFVTQKGLIEKQIDSEIAKKGLIERQTKGFDDDAKQKLMKQMLDSWSVAYSVAKDANSIPDSIKVNPIDSVTKNAMDALGIVKSNNPLNEA